MALLDSWGRAWSSSTIREAFIRVELPGRKHSTVTVHRPQVGV